MEQMGSAESQHEAQYEGTFMDLTSAQSPSSRKQISRQLNYLPSSLDRKGLHFGWKLIRFIVLNYYLLEAILASTFQSLFILTTTTLLPLNVVLFLFLAIDLVYKFTLVERLDLSGKTRGRNLCLRRSMKMAHYFLMKKKLLADTVVLVVFYISYLVPFSVARFLRLAIGLRILEIVEFNQIIYTGIHSKKLLTKLYTILKIIYVMFVISHYFGCWFFLIDQILLENQTYGTPASSNQLYFQMNMVCYTPIEKLGDWGRYLYGLYFMASLISTIAYGDIVGKNPYEEVYVTILMVLSTISIGMILEQFMMMVRDDSLGLYKFIKDYNSLKICMDDSCVSQQIQNKVRSYLVYSEHEKKLHAHEPTANRLTQKLQKELKYQAYAHFIAPIMTDILTVGLASNWRPSAFRSQRHFASLANVKELCSACSEVFFQAQTDVYEELFTTDWKSKCSFLIKIDGTAQQYIKLGRNSHSVSPSPYKRHASLLQHKHQHSHTLLPSDNKICFNLTQFLLNFNYRAKVQASRCFLGNAPPVGEEQISTNGEQGTGLIRPNLDGEPEADQNDGLAGLKTKRRPDIYHLFPRGLMSVKITHFIMLRLEGLEKYLEGKPELCKEMRRLRERIYCQEQNLRKLGLQCEVCAQDDHTVENCPSLHFVSSSKIRNAQNHINRLVRRQSQRKSGPNYTRRNIQQRKLINKPHSSVLIMKILKINNEKFDKREEIVSEGECGKDPEKPNAQINDKDETSMPLFLYTAFQRLINSEEKGFKLQADSSYDPGSPVWEFALTDSYRSLG